MVLLNILLKREIMKQMWKGKRGRKSWQKWEEKLAKYLKEASIIAVQTTGLVTELNPWLILEGRNRLVHI